MRALGDLLAHDLLGRFQARTGALDRQLRDALAHLDVLVEPQAESIVDDVLDHAGGLARGQPLLGLAGELRILQPRRQHEGEPLPHIFRRQLHATRQQVADVAELTDRGGQAGAQAIDVGAALRGGNQVDVAFLHQFALGQPGQRHFQAFDIARHVVYEQFVRQCLGTVELTTQVIAQAILVMPFDDFSACDIGEFHVEACAQHGLGAKQVLELAQRNLR